MHRLKMRPKKILFLFVLISTLFYNGIILLDKINQNPFPFEKSFFLQTENGRIRLEHKNQNTYCLNNKCGTLLNIKDTGFNFVFNDQISTLFFKTDQKEHFKKSSLTSAFPLKNKKNLFSFKYKTNQDTLTINVTQDGLCYHNNTKMPFIFVAGGKSIPSNTALQKTFLISEMDSLVFKRNSGEFFTLNIQKSNVYQIVTPPQKNLKKEAKFLLLLSSYKRPIYLINQIQSFLHQTYKQENFDFAVSVKGVDENTFLYVLKNTLQDKIDKKRLFLQQHDNKDQFTNLLNTYEDIDLTPYDYLCKIDDDDWYHKNYLSVINTIISHVGKPDFITAGNLIKTNQNSTNLFLTQTYTPFIGATICFSKEFAQTLKTLKNQIPESDKIYEDNFLNKLAQEQGKKYLYLTSNPTFIYNRATPSITRHK